MAGTQPQPPGPGASSEQVEERSRWWWWIVVVAVAAAVVLLVVQPWAEHQTEPPPGSTPSSASDVPSTPSSAPSPTTSTPAPVPGADAVFDETTLPTLFVTDADLVAAVPAAASSPLQPGIGAGELPWGLPSGSTIEPASCTTAATVVADEPEAFDARSSSNEAVDWAQRVTVLDDGSDARAAFADLVTTVDACPEYSQVNPGIDGSSWVAQPAIEGQGAYPSIVQERTHQAEGSTLPEYRGHMLVGNTIVTWTATALAADADPDAALATLGDPSTLNAMVQARAQQAVGGLG
ncbi:hypothetical protein [Cellulomonas rhizosphaerae]|uniref:Sensor domain-containing protein n=1 Tax=Cellulomonas rhizosphaerae TaxID=2293719 RepID=A0A413RIW0_9CELL|nr:hypothetical protein [Cellulomonas rhizosphaerae]RHA38325.1 hypothetical protein D1825_14620 [Cellulomonas rhizosphaerae]